MKQLNKEIKPANYAKINQLSKVFISQKAKSCEELSFTNTSKTKSVSKSVSKSISIPNEEFSDDTSPSVARKFLNEVKGTIVTLQQADESLAKHKALEYEIERLLRTVECKNDKISYDKAYNDMQQKIERLQAQLGDLKGKSQDTPCVSDTLDPLSKKLADENFIPKVVESNALSKPVTSNSVPSTREPKVVNNDRVIALGMLRINPSNTSRVDNVVPNKPVKPRSNTKNDRVPSASNSSCIENKEVEVEEHYRNLLLSKNKKHMSSECNNIKLAIQNDKSEVVCAMCKRCLITANHDVCVLKWSPTGRMFDLKGKIIKSSESECQSDSFRGRSNMFMVRRLGMLKAYDRKSEASYKFRLEVSGNGSLWK
ncbi:hypothetical protein Tco_1303204 [Tanacetum coccineum]